jgi:hypothetical protein
MCCTLKNAGSLLLRLLLLQAQACDSPQERQQLCPQLCCLSSQLEKL